MSDLSAIRAKVYAENTFQHVPLLTRHEARMLLGRIEAAEQALKEIRAKATFELSGGTGLERTCLSIICRTADEALEVPDELK